MFNDEWTKIIKGTFGFTDMIIKEVVVWLN